MKRPIILIFFCFCCQLLWAQPSNDDCSTPIVVPGSSNWCSAVGEYTNVAATPSGYGAATCFGTAGNDVWFRFTATGTDVTITVNGNQSPTPGGTLVRPQVALYSNTCGGTISQFSCGASPVGVNICNMYEGGLIVGQTYLIRVQGTGGGTGTFQLCLNNYNAPAQPGSDCVSASILCDKSPFVVQSVTSAGNDPDEASSSCLGGLGSNSESNSTWFKWTCDQSGTLTFTLRPNNASDDLDFVLYELPNGINSCVGKVQSRCMAAGDNTYPSSCMGPTGLRTSSTDVTETAGCGPGKDNFLAALNMVAGRSYALLINNFSETGNGFSIEFGGTGTFRGPTADFNLAPAQICAGQSVSLTDNSSFPFGTITSRNWTFGVGTNPSSSTATGPHTVQYSQPGQIPITLTVHTNLGCVVTHVEFVQVDSCCTTLNRVQFNANVTNVNCPNVNTGAIAITNTSSSAMPLTYTWSNGAAGSLLSNLDGGNYAVTVSNGICRDTHSYVVVEPPSWNVIPQITRPTCDGGQDGAISLGAVTGANGIPYQYNWNNTGFGSNTHIQNLSNGLYSLRVRDSHGCDTTLSIAVHELEIELDSVLMQSLAPRCMGDSNGLIQVVVANGLAPFSYLWASGQTSTLLQNLPAGSYTLLEVMDANRCKGGPFVFNLQDPPQLFVSADSTAITCFGANDGTFAGQGSGGIPPYQYSWTGVGQTGQDSFAIELPGGLYQFSVEDANGCVHTVPISIREPESIRVDSIKKWDAICYGSSDGLAIIFAAGGTGGYSYALTNPQGPFAASNQINNLAAGGYTVYIRDSEGCQISTSFSIGQPQPIWVDAGPDREVDLGDTLHLFPELSYVDYYDYQWSSTAGYYSCDTCRRTAVTAVNDGWHHIQIRSELGCIATDSLFINVYKRRRVFIPNAFTPNNDGVNDFLQVYGRAEVAQIKRYLVFDRWGELVFEHDNIPLFWRESGWDGNFKGAPMNAGVYVYMIEVEFIDGVVERYAGDVTLIR